MNVNVNSDNSNLDISSNLFSFNVFYFAYNTIECLVESITIHLPLVVRSDVVGTVFGNLPSITIQQVTIPKSLYNNSSAYRPSNTIQHVSSIFDLAYFCFIFSATILKFHLFIIKFKLFALIELFRIFQNFIQFQWTKFLPNAQSFS